MMSVGIMISIALIVFSSRVLMIAWSLFKPVGGENVTNSVKSVSISGFEISTNPSNFACSIGFLVVFPI